MDANDRLLQITGPAFGDGHVRDGFFAFDAHCLCGRTARAET